MISDTSFKGIPVAKAKTPFNTFQMYKITPDDSAFIQKIQKSINLRALMPGLDNEEYEIWEGVTRTALTNPLDKSDTFIITTQNKPCGVMNISQKKASFDLNFISTWPVKQGEKVPFAGKALFTELFRRFVESKQALINLVALRYAPFDPVGKYLKLGFMAFGGNNYTEIMRINQGRASKTLETLKQHVSLEPIKDAKNVDLLKELNINA